MLHLPGNKSCNWCLFYISHEKYLDFVDKATFKEEYKSELLAAYPNYGGDRLIDIYLAYYLKKD
ncbi:hypothetical protein [Xanthocytophaga agilis]|uniref:Uncharacterized protein n=1 Tax=Xanthocytophaga agilis TaxID=3048010 RepID=A0AAE3RC96_9BACT|nr:hypothetical protein [Xanthocytophaga agilis]MDJ1505720.1 hypothetical protein [Xanthocytophaga agilis]